MATFNVEHIDVSEMSAHIERPSLTSVPVRAFTDLTIEATVHITLKHMGGKYIFDRYEMAEIIMQTIMNAEFSNEKKKITR